MLKKMRDLLRDEQGFTLVELMVVIVILGILAGIGIPTYKGFVERAYKAELEVAERTLLLALELYRFDHGSYPEPSTEDKLPVELHTEGLYGIDDFEETAYVEKGEWPEGITVSYYAQEGHIKEKPAFTLQGKGNSEKHYNTIQPNEN